MLYTVWRISSANGRRLDAEFGGTEKEFREPILQ